MPQARQLSALMLMSVGKAESQPMNASAEADDATAVVASTAAVKVTRILMVSSLQCVICAEFSAWRRCWRVRAPMPRTIICAGVWLPLNVDIDDLALRIKR